MSQPLLSSSTAQQLGNAASHLSAIGSSLDDENGQTINYQIYVLLATSLIKTVFNSLLLSLPLQNVGRNKNIQILIHNLSYFSGNYLLIIIALSIYAIITNWWLLFTVAFLVGGFYLITRIEGPINMFGTTINSSTLYSGYVAGSLLLLLFSGATGAVFWVIGAGALLILTHAAIIEPSIETEFADDQV
ncbi:unnamed protein product [Cunninghamella echinulata]